MQTSPTESLWRKFQDNQGVVVKETGSGRDRKLKASDSVMEQVGHVPAPLSSRTQQLWLRDPGFRVQNRRIPGTVDAG